MFNSHFYPTPPEVIAHMLDGEIISGKVFLEPSAGKADIVKYLQAHGAKDVIACEINPDLRDILKGYCKIIAEDFLTVKSEQVSHVDHIVMNPPFHSDETHILHAYDIAPAGCKITALCNLNTLTKTGHSKARVRLAGIVDECGRYENLGDCFSEAERKTGVEVALIKIQKPGAQYESEFEGFFMEEDPEENNPSGLMPYNFIRDLVHRYVMAVQVFDEQLEAGVKMKKITSGFFSSSLGFSCTEDGKPKERSDFKKDMQKEGWKFIFEKMDMKKHMTRGLKEDINKFVEKQEKVPFTMRNIYKMLEIVIGTTSQRMDKALVEVFEKVTNRCHENRYNLEGWKTNSHYLLNEKFIIDRMCPTDKWNNGPKIHTSYGDHFEVIEDLMKALCYITGDNYDNFGELRNFLHGYQVRMKELTDQYKNPVFEHSEPVYGEWFEWGYFKLRAYKKGTMHFAFKDQNLWAMFNQRIAKIKGYPLPDHMQPKPERKKRESKQKTVTEPSTELAMVEN